MKLLTSIVFAYLMTFVSSVFAGTIDLSHTEFADKLAESSDVVIIDVRSAAEFAQGRIPNAVNIPHQSILDDISLLDGYQDKQLILYCRSGRRVHLVTDFIETKTAGTRDGIFHLDGDMLAWQAANKPIEKPSVNPEK